MSALTLGPVSIVAQASDVSPPRYSAAYLNGEPIPVGLPDADEVKPGDVVRVEQDERGARVIVSRGVDPTAEQRAEFMRRIEEMSKTHAFVLPPEIASGGLLSSLRSVDVSPDGRVDVVAELPGGAS